MMHRGMGLEPKQGEKAYPAISLLHYLLTTLRDFMEDKEELWLGGMTAL